MSRHSKRISVFDRLGPGNDGEATTHHPTVRHRHYSEKHSLPDERSRDKREQERGPRKRRHGYDDVEPTTSSIDSRPTKREKPVLASRRSDIKSDREKERHSTSFSDKSKRHRSSTSHSSTEGGESDNIEEREKKKGSHTALKRSKSLREPVRGERRERVDERIGEGEHHEGDTRYYHIDEERSKRKREREALSDGEMGHPKRMKMDGSVKDDHRDKGKSFDRSKQKRDRGIDGSVHKKVTRKRSIYDSFSDSESESHVIDWFSLVKIPLPKLKERKTSVMERLKAGAIFSKIGVSVELAGPELSNQIQSLVSTHMKERFGDHQIPWEVTPDVFGGHSQGNSVASFVKEHIQRMETLYDIGTCRRALTARVDYNMRKKLRNNKKVHLSSPSLSNTMDSEMFSSSVTLYQQNTSDSQNHSYKLEPSHIGNVIVHT